MGANSAIEWTRHTFNPWRGCTHVSPGCEHCYAESLAHRFPATHGTWGAGGQRVIASEAYWRQPLAWNRAAAAAGERHRVFCASLADVFEDRPELVEPRDRLIRLIAVTPHLDWLLLTKRPDNAHWMLSHLADHYPWLFDPPNLWLGTSVEDQRRADERISLLLDTPAAVRFLSCEPLLGPVDLDLGRCEVHGRDHLWDDPRGEQRCGERAADGSPGELSYGHWLDPLNGGIDWVIVGGESGPGARPMDLAWARQIVTDCAAAGVPVFVKQIGARPLINDGEAAALGQWPSDLNATIGKRKVTLSLRDRKGGDPDEWPPDLRVRQYPPPWRST